MGHRVGGFPVAGGACLAQFTGGTGDGHDQATRYNFAFPNGPGNSGQVDIAFGGIADGQADATLYNAYLDPTQPALAGTAALAMGGTGDGFDQLTVANVYFDPAAAAANWPAGLALGGPGDGFEQATLYNAPLDPNSPQAVWPAGLALGGIADGHDQSTLNNAPINPQAPGATWPAGLAIGGSGDGFDAQAAYNVYLDPTAPSATWPDGLAVGGQADGFSDLTVSAISLSAVPGGPTIYFGGGSDGFDSLTLYNVQLGGQATAPIYNGGPADGFDDRTTYNIQFAFYFGSPAAYQTWQSALFTPAQIEAGLAAPTADANGDGIPNMIAYAFGLDPMHNSTADLPAAVLSNLSDFGYPAGGPVYLSMVIPRSANAIDAEIIPEITGSLGLLDWSSQDVVVVQSTADWMVVRDKDTVNPHGARFMRVRVLLRSN